MKITEKLAAVTLTTALMLAACAPAATSPSLDSLANTVSNIEPVTLILANASAEDTVTGLMSHRFAELVYELSGGTMVVDVFPNSQLGGD
ncbi:MAG: C4-dicarboxylate ABC transporter, partial [Defluviitaleaceae bacterium]|nr:C4-dicarboxylate ABC transporter [Defluviitaleaceae bacterium]